jgi:hypothetical protein
MFLPYTLRAAATSLNQDQKLLCLCGKQVRLGDCLLCWTTTEPDKEPGWYCACTPECIVIRASAGNA